MSQRAGHASKPNLLDLVLTSKQDNSGITCKAPSVVLTTADFAGLVSCMTVVTEQLVLAQIFGIRYGLRGFYDRSATPWSSTRRRWTASTCWAARSWCMRVLGVGVEVEGDSPALAKCVLVLQLVLRACLLPWTR